MKRFFTFLLAAFLVMQTTAQTDCSNPYDGNGDGAVTVTDLLGLLVFFGDSDVDMDGIWDSVDECVDTSACNYAADPTEPCAYDIDALGICGGDCEADDDGDGICDVVDPCVGELDECGSCNGPGPTEAVIDDIVLNYDSVFLPLDNEWFVFPVSADTTFTFTCAPCTEPWCGCIDPEALNYDADADYDDGSCQYELLGCTDGMACNFNIEATTEDGSCVYFDACGTCDGPGAVYECGCSDLPVGDCDCDGNQLDALGVCGGDCAADADMDGICDDVDDCVGELDACGICNGPGAIYECGCADIPAGDCDCDGNQLDALDVCGGDCAADADMDGICDDVDDCVGAYDACGICNGPGAIYECGCADIPAGDCDCDGNQLDALDVCGGDCTADADMDGICDDVDDCVGELDACDICNGPGEIYECGCADIPAGDCDCDGNQLDALGVCGGDCAADADMDGICDDVDDCVGELDACGMCNGPGAIYECGCADIPSGDCDCDGNQLDALDVCGGDCPADEDADGICDDEDECVGELDACGVCNGPGEIDECGCSDIEPGFCDCDGNQLDALGVCGGDCAADADMDGICDDVDDCVGELDACGICNGPGEIYECGCADIPAGDCDCNGNQHDALGECGGDCAADADMDGICDDVDDCVGAYDACGICNGPGEIYECGCSNIPAGDCDCDGNQLDALGECGGACVADADEDGICDDVDDCIGGLDECPPIFNQCTDLLAYQGYNYETVLIGDQCWFAENLRNENYDNGESIPSNLTGSAWNSTTSGATALYGEEAGCQSFSPDIDACDPSQSLMEYGRLYNWYAVNDSRGLCPSGWHVPSDEEWTVMTEFLGGGSAAGVQMKALSGWSDNGNGTNSSGFNGLPGGGRNGAGNTFFAGQDGGWWSSSYNNDNPWGRFLAAGFDEVARNPNYVRDGFSVRCVRDAE